MKTPSFLEKKNTLSGKNKVHAEENLAESDAETR